MDQHYKKHSCITCGVLFCITKEYDQELQRNKKGFYCPNGHSQSYVGKTDKELLEEQKRKSQRYYKYFEEEVQKVKQLERINRTLKGHISRYKKKTKKEDEL